MWLSKFFNNTKRSVELKAEKDQKEPSFVFQTAVATPKEGEVYFVQTERFLSLQQMQNLHKTLKDVFGPAKVAIVGPDLKVMTVKETSDAIAKVKVNKKNEAEELLFADVTYLSPEKCSHCGKSSMKHFTCAAPKSPMQGVVCEQCKDAYEKGLRPLSKERRMQLKGTILENCSTEEEVTAAHFTLME